MIKLSIKGWKYEDQVVKIKDRTHTVLPNGKRIPTGKNMERRLLKHSI